MSAYGSLFVSFLKLKSTGTGNLKRKLRALRVADFALAEKQDQTPHVPVLADARDNQTGQERTFPKDLSATPISSRLRRPAFAAALTALLTLPASAGVTLDARVSQDNNSAAGTVTSGLFSTSGGNELLLAFVAADSSGSPNTSVQSVSGGGLVWQLVERTNIRSGTSEIWRAFAPGALTGVSVTAQLSQSVQSSLTVMSFSGVDPSGANGSGAIGAVALADSAGGAPAATLTSTRNNSIVVGVGNDYDNAIPRLPSAGQTIIHQSLAAAGDTYWVQWQAAPVPSAGTTVTLGDTSPSTDQYNFSICEILPAPAGDGAQVQASAASLDYGSVAEGNTTTQSLTLKSTGSAPVTINSAAVAGTGFALGASNFPVTLAVGHSLTLDVAFDPQTTGAVSGNLSVGSDAANEGTLTVPLTGAGVAAASSPQLSLSVSSLSFGSVATGGTASKTVTLISTGTSAVTISSESKTGAPFKLRETSYPLTLSPGKTASFRVEFKPQTSGASTGQVSVVSNSATKSNATVSLSGTGVSSQHSVTLTWTPPTSSPVPVTGYNVYRAQGSGSFSRINSSSSSSASYSDAGVASGSTYSYEVKSVAGGTESAPSSQITVTIPNP